ncbi:hypothetical protein AAY473_036176 [Plecturocebus cupreus]
MLECSGLISASSTSQVQVIVPSLLLEDGVSPFWLGLSQTPDLRNSFKAVVKASVGLWSYLNAQLEGSASELAQRWCFTMLARMVLISRPHDPPASSSQSARITDMSHHARPV